MRRGSYDLNADVKSLDVLLGDAGCPLRFTAIEWGEMNLVPASEFAGKENAGLAVGSTVSISLIGNLLWPPIFG